MKKVVLALIVSMLAVPALAGVVVDCNITDVNLVTVTYEMVGGDANLPRAFGLDIIADANISMDTTLPSDDINDSDYYIYPGSIDVNDDDGTVDDYGTPVAILDANVMTIEMGSLYASNDPDHNTAPPASGWVIKFRVAKASNINVDIRENVDRGGVVMEDVNYVGDVVCGDCNSSPVEEDYDISGTVTYMGSGLDGVTMSGLPNSPIVTAGGGLYSDTVSSGWSGTVTPSMTGYGFTPTNRVYSNVTSDQLNQDYCAYPGCWDCLTQCHGDGDAACSGTVDIGDWPDLRDGFLKSYPAADYLANVCGDFNRDGSIDIGDWPPLRDNFLKSPDPNCPQGDINSVYCP